MVGEKRGEEGGEDGEKEEEEEEEGSCVKSLSDIHRNSQCEFIQELTATQIPSSYEYFSHGVEFLRSTPAITIL